MRDRLFDLSLDLHSARSYFAYVSNPLSHYQRLFTQFDAKQRIKILHAAHTCILGVSTRTDRIEIYVADSLVNTKPESLNDLRQSTVVRVASILAGEDPRGLAEVLLSSVLNTADVTGVFSLISTALNATVLTPNQAAALIACLDHSENDVQRARNSPTEIEQELKTLPRGTTLQTFDDSDDERPWEQPGQRFTRISTYSLADSVDKFCEDIDKNNADLRHLLMRQEALVAPEHLCRRFHVETQSTEIYVPPKQRILIAQTMQEAVAKAQHDRSSLLAMSPREFEEFMAYIFSNLGFDVELTKASRDGGADLLCLRSLHGVPFRLAVEVKRYRETRPVTVSLVRSFVGANREFKANRLLFVTTSRYTQPAIDYATNHASHLLTLTDYAQIKEWCDVVRSTPTSMF